MVVNECPRTVMPANYPCHSCLFKQKMSHLLHSFLAFHFITYPPSHLTLPDHPHLDLSIFNPASGGLAEGTAEAGWVRGTPTPITFLKSNSHVQKWAC